MFKWILVTIGSIGVTASAAFPALARFAIALLAGGLMLFAERRRRLSQSLDV